MSGLPKQEADTERLRRLVILTLIAVILVYVGYSLIASYYRTILSRRCEGPLAPTADEIRQIIDANTQLGKYRAGTAYLKTMKKLSRADALKLLKDYKKRDAIEYCVTMDFFRTITPQQVKALRGKLPFTSLSPKQQSILRSLPGYIWAIGTDPRKSYLTLCIYRVGLQTPYAPFGWCVKKSNGEDLYYVQTSYWLDDAAKNIKADRQAAERLAPEIPAKKASPKKTAKGK